MNRLEVRSHQVGVPPRHLQRAVTQHFLQVEHGPAEPQIIHAGRMLKTVNCPCRGHDAQPLTQKLHVSELVPTPEPLALLRCEYEVKFIELPPAIQVPPQLEADRDKPVLCALAVELQEQVVKVHVRPSQRHGLAATTACVNQREDEDV